MVAESEAPKETQHENESTVAVDEGCLNLAASQSEHENPDLYENLAKLEALHETSMKQQNIYELNHATK